MNESIWKLDATAQAELVARGEVGPTELVAAALERVEALNPTLGAAIDVRPRQALEAARVASSGPFMGVPTLVKDVLPYPGFRCSFGSRLFAGLGHTPTEHLPYTQAIEASGLVPLGKSATSEFGLLGSTETLLEGSTRNPWDLSRSAGGSSGGAAAAVAAGLVPIAHASDGGGSIRIPAALCGLFGFKPSRGRSVSAALSPNDFANLVTEHCISRSVRDSARFLACTERRDAASPHPPVGYVVPREPRTLRIGVLRTSLVGAPASGQDALATATRLCVELGHRVEEAPPLTGLGAAISESFFTVAAAAMHEIETSMTGLLGRPLQEDELEPFTWALIRWIRRRPSDAIELARRRLAEASATMLEAQFRWDVTLSPTIGIATPQLGFLSPELPRETLVARTEQLAAYTPAHNVAGAPAMSVPLHVDGDGLPVGCHFAAMPGDDATLLQLAYQLEEAAPWADRWPAFARA